MNLQRALTQYAIQDLYTSLLEGRMTVCQTKLGNLHITHDKNAADNKFYKFVAQKGMDLKELGAMGTKDAIAFLSAQYVVEMESNKDKFLATYKKNLAEAVKKYPNDYVWGLDELETVYGRMAYAIEKGTFNKDSQAFKMTCKELGIKHTYKAIQEYIK